MPRCLLQGAYAEGLTLRSSSLGVLYSEVSTPRCIHRGAYSEVPTSRYLHQGVLHEEASSARCLRQGAYSKVCSAWGPLLQGTYAEVPTPRYASPGGHCSEVPTSGGMLRGAHFKDTYSLQHYLLLAAYSKLSTRKCSLQGFATQGNLLSGAYDPESTLHESPPRTPSLRQGHRVCDQ